MSDFKPKLNKTEKTALDILLCGGFEAYTVGGCLRDRIMGIVPGDVDITTSALPQQIKEVFSGYKVVETGIKHGTVTVVMDGEPVEITTFRKEQGYSDNRHPDKVEFNASLREDLSRRDFTVNALAYNEQAGLVDEFGGITDIKNKIIRCVGDPVTRFEEDALRILRGVRFAATLGFGIEKNTADAIKKCVHLLKNVSRERQYIELKKLLCGKYAGEVLREYSFVITAIIPQLAQTVGHGQYTPYHAFDIYTHTTYAVEAIPPVPHLRLAALLHDCAKPEKFYIDENGVGHFKGHAPAGAQKAEEILKSFKADNFTVNRVSEIIFWHDDRIPNDEDVIIKWLGKLGKDVLFDLLRLECADNSAKGKKSGTEAAQMASDALKTAQRLVNEGVCFTVGDLNINGRDLKENGIPAGKQIGAILNALLKDVMAKKLPNKREELLKAALLFAKGENK